MVLVFLVQRMVREGLTGKVALFGVKACRGLGVRQGSEPGKQLTARA